MRLRDLRMVWVFTAVLLCGRNIGAQPADASLEALFRRMDAASKTFKSLRADMTKVHHTDFVHEEETDTGNILVKRPKPRDFHVVIHFVQPDPKDVALNGTKLQIYYPKRNAIEEYDLGKNHKNQVEQFVLLGFGSNSQELANAYNVSLVGREEVAGKQTTRIVLIPKSDEVKATFPKFELWIADDLGIAVQQKAYESGEKDYSLATYRKVQINPDIPDSEMRLAIPRNAQRQKPQKDQ